jgi:GNAT superfamily N-acetyltransferase
MQTMGERLRIRPAAAHERAGLEALQWRASLEWEDYRAALLAHPDAIELPAGQIAAGQVQVAEKDGIIVGFCVVLPREDGGAELDGLFVDPPHWRRGIGRRLVDHAAAAAAQAGAGSLHVIANPRALEFYRACEFQPSGEAQTRFGPAMTMRRQVGTKST